MYIDLLQVYHQQLSTLEREIEQLAVQLEEYELLQTIPGVGEKIAATFISEIGEIDRFSHPKKLVAFAGLDPSVFESGRFKGTKNHITKRGSARLRHMLFTAVRCSIRDSRKKKTTEETIAQNEPGKVLLTDITYLYLENGTPVYLSCVKDGSTREILAYYLSTTLEMRLVYRTLDNLIDALDGNIHPEAILHSDQGFHYTNPECRLKDEIDTSSCQSLTQLREVIEDYIVYYNSYRY